jgi:hypothetical protein
MRKQNNLCQAACFPPEPSSSHWKLQEVNDYASALDKGPSQNPGQDEKQRALGQEIAACFALKIIAANIEKGVRRAISRSASETIERKRLIIKLDPWERAARRKVALALAILPLSDRFHVSSI